MKEYFSHDYNSRNDTKLVKLFMKHGLAGIGAYWCIIEMLYEESGYLLKSEYERISFELRIDKSVIQDIVENKNYNLFETNEKSFFSTTALERIKLRKKRSASARKSISYRWNNRNTNVQRTKNESNTIKVKESKVNKKKENVNIPCEIKVNFIQYVLMRKSIKKPMTEHAQNLAIKKLSDMGDFNTQNKIIEQSIFNSWQGLFPLKEDNKNVRSGRIEGTSEGARSKPGEFEQTEKLKIIDWRNT